MTPARIPEVHYRLAGLAGGAFPGHHRSRSGDGGFEFRAHAPLFDVPDARRLDLHASLRDPFGRWLVRVNSLRKAIPVAVVADLSASMGFEGAQRKLDVLADFTASLAWSAWRTGDSFGFVGCDERVRADWLLPQTRQRGAGIALAGRLRSLRPQGRSAAALREAHRHLPHARSLVFLVSDFHLPLPQVAEVLASLTHHEVVPVLLWQPSEFELAPTRGLVQGIDPESGQRRWLWWRPALRERWRAAQAERRAALGHLFAAQQRFPLLIDGPFDPDAVTRHFLA
ncbi:MAG: MxaS protein [Piscinibacter sp.]|nr:MxaS protein [Piscinibacter sp.]